MPKVIDLLALVDANGNPQFLPATGIPYAWADKNLARTWSGDGERLRAAKFVIADSDDDPVDLTGLNIPSR